MNADGMTAEYILNVIFGPDRAKKNSDGPTDMPIGAGRSTVRIPCQAEIRFCLNCPRKKCNGKCVRYRKAYPSDEDLSIMWDNRKVQEICRGRLMSDERKWQWAAMVYAEGYSRQKIAKFLKCDPKTVARNLGQFAELPPLEERREEYEKFISDEEN